MRPLRPALAHLIALAPAACASQTRAAAPPTDADAEALLDLSQQKWRWMADRDVDALAALFHPDARFVHMGGTWGTARELEVIESGDIWYKHADVHEAVVGTVGETAIVWNRITLLAEVGGTEVTNPFAVTEVYRREDGGWTLLALSFSSIRDGHTIEP